MQAKPLHINIPKPCSQNFAEMPKQGDGLYCGQCSNIVYDFSMMTDYELLQFFKTKPDVHCGKFHNSQLNRNIEPVVIKNKFLHKISAIAASVFSLLALKPNAVKAQGVVKHFNTEKNTAVKNTTTVFKDSINIKGVVKNEKNEPLQNVVVKMDGVGEVKSDANGQYDFGLITVKEAHNVYYSCPNYVPVVRTYNAAMGNTVMDIVMGHRDSNAVVYNNHTGGVPIFYSGEEVNFPTLVYKENFTSCKDEKQILKAIAVKLKENPTLNIFINAYSKTTYKSQEIANKRLKTIQKYLTEKEGISADRISTNAEVSELNSGLIEFKSQ